jgi:hypothetical protein
LNEALKSSPLRGNETFRWKKMENWVKSLKSQTNQAQQWKDRQKPHN